MIRNIVFDLGKVLLTFEPEAFLETLGFDAKTRQAVMTAMFHSPMWDESDRGELTPEELEDAFAAADPAHEQQIRQAYGRVGDTIGLMPYACEWIRELKARGYHLYILSNYSRRTYEQSVEKMTFLPDMDGAVFSFQCRLIKPEPAIYRFLCEKYGLNPCECVFLDDREENVQQACLEGFRGIRFQNYGQAGEELERLLAEQEHTPAAL